MEHLDSAKGEIDAIERAERELLVTEEELRAAEAVSFGTCAVWYLFFDDYYLILYFYFQERAHYQGLMNNKVLSDIKEAQEHYEQLKHNRQVNLIILHIWIAIL